MPMPSNSRNEGSKGLTMTWRTISGRPSEAAMAVVRAELFPLIAAADAARDQALADAVASETNQAVLCALADEAGGVLRN